jgi:TonB-linked SusC/RagA family outer membrane protein
LTGNITGSGIQQIEVTGIVTDPESGIGLPGVNVYISGTTIGVITNLDGEYSISVPSGESVLVFSYVGYETQEIMVGNQTRIDVVMNLEIEALEEVVVVGYGVQKKETVTGSIVSVKSKELIQTPVANISNSLAGRLPGLVTVQSSGVPGEDMAKIRIRGIGTLNPGSESAPLILVDGVEHNTLNQIDPNEIESINILKDASATAVYGVRGANGVILVTTRRGKFGKPKIQITSNLAVSTPSFVPKWLDSYNYAILRNEALENDNLGPTFSDEEIQKFKDGSDPIFYPVNDQYNEFVNNPALQHQHNVNISGGTKTLNYFISAGLFDQFSSYHLPELDYDVGFDPSPRYTRYNLRSNFDISISKDLTVNVQMGGYYDNKRNANKFNPNANNPNSAVLNYWGRNPPMTSIGYHEGKLITGYLNDPFAGRELGRGYSIYESIYSGGVRERIANNFTLNTGFNYDLGVITEGLSARGKIAYTHYYSYEVRRSKSVNSYSYAYDPGGNHTAVQTGFEGAFGFNESYDMWRRYYMEVGLYYLRRIGNHEVSGLVLYNKSKLHDPGLQYKVPNAYLGLVSRVTYNFKNRYMAEFNMGYNGSENFAKDKRFGLFPAYSLGWVLTEEPFFPENNILTYLKFRGSYGEVGNDKIGGDRFLYLPPVYHYPANNWLDDGYYFGEEGVNLQYYEGANEGAVGNPDLTWEVAEKTNIGVDLRLFRKLALHGDFFQEKRDNILWAVTVNPGIIASELVPGNIGKVDNKGFELEARWNDDIGQVDYFINANYSFARNKIVYKAEPSHKYNWLDETGFSVGQFRSYRNEGFYNTHEELVNRPYYLLGGNTLQGGDLVSVDIDGNGIINQYDIVPTGYNDLPEIFFGISAGMNVKGFDFSVLLQGASNFYTRVTGTSAWAFNNGPQATLAKHIERWNADRFDKGLPITQPRLMQDGGEGVNTKEMGFYLRDRTYLRLRNAEIGYRYTFTKIIGIEYIRFYINGVNLFTWSRIDDFDPETPDSQIYPIMRTFNLGASVQF